MDLVQCRSNKLDRVGMIFGLDVAPGAEVVDAGSNRQARRVEGYELVILIGSGPFDTGSRCTTSLRIALRGPRVVALTAANGRRSTDDRSFV